MGLRGARLNRPALGSLALTHGATTEPAPGPGPAQPLPGDPTRVSRGPRRGAERGTGSVRQPDLRVHRVRTIQDERPADDLDEMDAVEACDERLARVTRVLRRGLQDLDLQQLAGVERVLDRPDRGFGDPFLPDLQDRFQGVGERFQVRPLLRGQGFDGCPPGSRSGSERCRKLTHGSGFGTPTPEPRPRRWSGERAKRLARHGDRRIRDPGRAEREGERRTHLPGRTAAGPVAARVRVRGEPRRRPAPGWRERCTETRDRTGGRTRGLALEGPGGEGQGRGPRVPRGGCAQAEGRAPGTGRIETGRHGEGLPSRYGRGVIAPRPDSPRGSATERTGRGGALEVDAARDD